MEAVDEPIRMAFQRLLAEMDELWGKVESGYFSPEGGSTLALDDEVALPLHFSSAPRWAIMSAIDHLKAIGFMLRNGNLPMVASATLIRTAIETSARAIYLLEPNDRRTRLRRFLADELHQEGHARRAIESFGGEEPTRSTESFVDDVLARWPELGSRADLRRAPIGDTVSLAQTAIESHVQRSRGPNIVAGWWNLMSGLTHGYRWAWQMALDVRQTSYDAASDLVGAEVSFEGERVLAGMRVALDAIHTAVRLYGLRAREFTRLREDTDLIAGLRRKAAGPMEEDRDEPASTAV